MLCTHGVVYPYKSKYIIIYYINLQELLVLLDHLAVYVTVLYNVHESNKYNWLIIRLLIITVLGYFTVLIFCHCIMLMYGETFKARANKIKEMFMMRWFTRNQTCLELFKLEQLSSKILNGAFKYHEFREPLVALD